MHFSVGIPPSPEDFAALAPHAIQQRTIIDPATPRTPFDWRAAFFIEPGDPSMQLAIAAALDRIAAIPEGSQLLRQAVAMQRERAAQSAAPGILTIRMGKETSFSGTTGSITLDPLQLAGGSYATASDPQAWDLTHALVHELMHAADSMTVPSYAGLLHANTPRLARAAGVDANDGFALFMFRMGDMARLYYENPIIEATNDFITTHLNLPARLLHHGGEDHSLITPPVVPNLRGTPSSPHR